MISIILAYSQTQTLCTSKHISHPISPRTSNPPSELKAFRFLGLDCIGSGTWFYLLAYSLGVTPLPTQYLNPDPHPLRVHHLSFFFPVIGDGPWASFVCRVYTKRVTKAERASDYVYIATSPAYRHEGFNFSSEKLPESAAESRRVLRFFIRVWGSLPARWGEVSWGELRWDEMRWAEASGFWGVHIHWQETDSTRSAYNIGMKSTSYIRYQEAFRPDLYTCISSSLLCNSDNSTSARAGELDTFLWEYGWASRRAPCSSFVSIDQAPVSLPCVGSKKTILEHPPGPLTAAEILQTSKTMKGSWPTEVALQFKSSTEKNAMPCCIMRCLELNPNELLLRRIGFENTRDAWIPMDTPLWVFQKHPIRYDRGIEGEARRGECKLWDEIWIVWQTGFSLRGAILGKYKQSFTFRGIIYSQQLSSVTIYEFPTTLWRIHGIHGYI